MVPRFSSQVDMMSFIKALPANANYENMLASDFGIIAPTEAPAYQKEYLFKYLVQGTYMGKTEAELMKYAAEGVEKLAATLPHITMKEIYGDSVPVEVKQQRIAKAPKAPKESSGKKRQLTKQPDGTIHWDDHRKTWVGWVGGKIVSCTKTVDKCKLRMTKLFGVTEFNQIDLVI